eukprot:CAMPEP_0185192294 /NCGR_PEP_ID=MMETSP1140-20130426/17853_1 /TAXON_ID=298111 /ORGANISM="Pavlova sp., Strain CCMP459" /LENGTH=192 /DNA_ID=CAMNT_0027759033 /DNA_START=216 /DNA_END=794 /DNA_ORIENTATION=+
MESGCGVLKPEGGLICSRTNAVRLAQVAPLGVLVRQLRFVILPSEDVVASASESAHVGEIVPPQLCDGLLTLLAARLMLESLPVWVDVLRPPPLKSAAKARSPHALLGPPCGSCVVLHRLPHCRLARTCTIWHVCGLLAEWARVRLDDNGVLLPVVMGRVRREIEAVGRLARGARGVHIVWIVDGLLHPASP